MSRKLISGLSLVVVFIMVVSGCGRGSEQAPEAAKPKYGTWGIETADMDKAVRPGDNFFSYAVGSWAKTAEIRPDEVSAGLGVDLQDQLEQDLKSILEGSAAQDAPQGETPQLVGDFYAAFLDENAAEQKGVEPLTADLAAIDAVTDKAGLSSSLAALDIADAVTPFPVSVGIDPNQPTRYLPVLWQGGLSFGERDYYLDDDPQFVDLRDKFVAHVERLLWLAGYPDAREQARQIMDLETKLAQVHWPREEVRDVQKTRTVMSRADVEKLAPGVPLGAKFDAQSFPADIDFQVGMPEVVTKTGQLFVTEPLETWKAYLRYQLLRNYGTYLSTAFGDEVFSFYAKELAGTEERSPRWKRGVNLVSGALGDAVGQLYVAERFLPETRGEVLDLVESLRRAYSDRIASANWMSPETKAEAQAKLAAMLSKLGYPDTWDTYDGVTIRADDLVGNVKSVEGWAWRDQLSHLGKPVDRAEWGTTPQTINAFYNRTLNDITFTAAILQPPYFDPAADPAVNFGAIGAVIGHEMSHGFDDQGRQADSTGALRDWWTAADAQRYEGEAERLVAQFDAYEPLPGQNINGSLTLGENIADLAGLRIAYDAYRLSLGGEEAPVIDGLTGDQRFLLAYAASWKTVYRPEFARDLLLSDSHSLPQYRVNGIVRNLDEWYAAFDVKEGDALYLRPENRVRIW